MRCGGKQVGILHKFKSIKCCESQILKGSPDFELTVRLTFSIINLLSGLGRSYFLWKIFGAEINQILVNHRLPQYPFGVIMKIILEGGF